MITHLTDMRLYRSPLTLAVWWLFIMMMSCAGRAWAFSFSSPRPRRLSSHSGWASRETVMMWKNSRDSTPYTRFHESQLLASTATEAKPSETDSASVLASGGNVIRPLRPIDIHRKMAEQRAAEEAASPDYRSPDVPRRLRRLQDLVVTRVDVDVRGDEGDRERLREFMGILASQAPDPKVGDILTGPVMSTNDRGVYLNVPGLGVPAFMPWSEVSLLPMEDAKERFPEGAVVSAKMIALDKFPVVSLRIAEFRAAWRRLLDLHGAGAVVDVTVSDVNRGGALCTCEGLRGFIPLSHFIGTPDHSHIGKQYKAKILQIDGAKQQVQFSLRQALMADFVSANGTVVKSAYHPGALLSGTVSGIMDFGVFLNLEGGGSGLLHRSSVSAAPIPRLGDVFHINQTIMVVVQSLDPITGRCALETRTLERRPGDIAANVTLAMEMAEETYKINTANRTFGVSPSSPGRRSYVRGDLVQGRVTGVADYGVFLTFPGGVSGLLHKADMSSESVGSTFPEGIALESELAVVVEAFNETSSRLRLSLLPLERYPGETLRNLTAMMADAAATLKRSTRYTGAGSSSGGSARSGSRYRQSKERLLAGSLRTMTSNPFDPQSAPSDAASAASGGRGADWGGSTSTSSSMPWKDDFIAKILRQINLESTSSAASASSTPGDTETEGQSFGEDSGGMKETGTSGKAKPNMDSLLTSIQESIENEMLVEESAADALESVTDDVASADSLYDASSEEAGEDESSLDPGYPNALLETDA